MLMCLDDAVVLHRICEAEDYSFYADVRVFGRNNIGQQIVALTVIGQSLVHDEALLRFDGFIITDKKSKDECAEAEKRREGHLLKTSGILPGANCIEFFLPCAFLGETRALSA